MSRVKSNSSFYRTIDGVLYKSWDFAESKFPEHIEQFKRQGLRYRIITVKTKEIGAEKFLLREVGNDGEV